MHSTEPIAIVGLAIRYPGNAVDAESFWQLLVSGQDAISEIPTDRWNARKHYHPDRAVLGKSYSRWGGFINGIDEFEPECFGISPREAAYIDPQQRLLLEVAWEAVEDAGYPADALAGTRTGVFIGISTSDYANIQTNPYKLEGLDAHTATGSANSIAANRISYCLNLLGPSFAVDTACSSSLVAVHLARRSLLNGECELALVGSVNVLLTPGPFALFSAASMLSPTGRCKAFDASADGFVRAEGAGAVLLKPLGKALEDNDPVHALLVGSGVNQHGRTSGISFPSQSSQEALLNAVLRDAGVSPHDVCYVEAHGTGTAVGDPVEATALGNVFGTPRANDHPCVIGTVKTNIGHLEAGAGMAGLIKTCLMLQHRKIPPNLHFNQPNPNIDFDRLHIRVPRSEEPLPEPGPVVLGINSFGFGGTNAHVLVREHASSPLPPRRGRQREVEPDTRDAGTTTPDNGGIARSPVLLPVSARSRPALETLAASYRRLLEAEAPLGHDWLGDLAYTASLRRTHYPHRLALVFASGDELVERLDAFLAGQTRPGLHAGESSRARTPKITFVFSGQGPQWWGMGRQLLECNPLFRSVIRKCDAWVRAYGGWSLWDELLRDQQTSRLHETAIAQPAICALQIGLAEVWKSWGIVPDAVVGHSVGEIAAAHVAGALDGEQAIRVIVQRGRCMDRASSRGGMVALGCSLDEAREAIREHSGEITVGAHNSPSSVTLSGDLVALEEIQKVFDGRGTSRNAYR